MVQAVRDGYERIASKCDYFNLLDEIGRNVKETAHTNILMRILGFRDDKSLPLLGKFL